MRQFADVRAAACSDSQDLITDIIRWALLLLWIVQTVEMPHRCHRCCGARHSCRGLQRVRNLEFPTLTSQFAQDSDASDQTDPEMPDLEPVIRPVAEVPNDALVSPNDGCLWPGPSHIGNDPKGAAQA